MMRRCKHCGMEKPGTAEFFILSKQCRGGITYKCKACNIIYMREWKARNRDLLMARRREIYSQRYRFVRKAQEDVRREREPYAFQARSMMGGVHERSAKLGFSVPPEMRRRSFFEQWLRRQSTCECCGVAFNIGKKGDQKFRNNSPSVDRFDPTRGYDLDNVALICWRCKNIKRNYMPHDLRMVAAWMDARVPSHKVIEAAMYRAPPELRHVVMADGEYRPGPMCACGCSKRVMIKIAGRGANAKFTPECLDRKRMEHRRAHKAQVRTTCGNEIAKFDEAAE